MLVKPPTPMTRRMFCFGSALAATAFAASCKPREKVFKYPENAEEIADFNEVFTSPGFNVAQAVERLKIIKEKNIRDDNFGWRMSEYGEQNDLVRQIFFSSKGEQLYEMTISYARSIDVSFGRLETLLGNSRDFGGPVGRLDLVRPLQTSMLSAPANVSANGPRRGGPPPYTNYGFTPERTSKDSIKGMIMISAKITDNNVKQVDSIRFSRLSE